MQLADTKQWAVLGFAHGTEQMEKSLSTWRFSKHNLKENNSGLYKRPKSQMSTCHSNYGIKL